MSKNKPVAALIKKSAAVTVAFLLIIQIFIPFAMQASAASDYVVIVTASSVNVRSGPGSNYSKLGVAYLGKVYDYIGEGKGSGGATWHKIQFSSSKTGWISGGYSFKTKRTGDYTQAFLNSVAKSYGAVGVQVAVIDKGVVTDTYNYGWATKSKDKMTSDHKIRVASVSKVAVAISAMKMHEQGIVDINANIGNYWGAKPYKAVTLKSMLTHTSTLKSLGYSTTKSGTLSQLKDYDSYTSGTVGSSGVWFYNNYAIGVAGATLEVASGKTLSAYTKTNIFEPLGIDAAMTSGLLKETSKLATLYHSNGNVARSVSAAAKFKGSTIPGSNANIYAGGLTCSAKDLAKMMAMLANDGTYNGVRILTPDSVSAIEARLFKKSEYNGSFHQCMPMRYKANLYGESELYYHTGNAYGVLALASYNPSTGDGVVVLTTGMSDVNTSPACSRDAQGIYEICGKLSEYVYKYHKSSVNTQPTTTATTTTTTTTKKATTATTAASETTVATSTTTATTASAAPSLPETTRLAGKSRYDTAIEIAKEHSNVLDEGEIDTVIIANGLNYADALAGVPLSDYLNAPILLTSNKGTLEESVLEQMKAFDINNVVILGGSSAVSEDISNQLKDMGLVVTRLSGPSRYDTAVEIAQYNLDYLDVTKTVFLVSGENFPDALSAGATAGITRANIIFCPQSGEIKKSVADFVTKNGVNNVIIVGGTGAVGERAETELAGLGVTSKRIYGASRYATSLAVYMEYFDAFDKSILTFATGENFPDALAGGALSSNLKAPVILVNNGKDNSVIKKTIDLKEVKKVIVYGGEAVVAWGTIERIFG